jgi:hypothetical protein
MHSESTAVLHTSACAGNFEPHGGLSHGGTAKVGGTKAAGNAYPIQLTGDGLVRVEVRTDDGSIIVFDIYPAELNSLSRFREIVFKADFLSGFEYFRHRLRCRRYWWTSVMSSSMSLQQ